MSLSHLSTCKKTTSTFAVLLIIIIIVPLLFFVPKATPYVGSCSIDNQSNAFQNTIGANYYVNCLTGQQISSKTSSQTNTTATITLNYFINSNAVSINVSPYCTGPCATSGNVIIALKQVFGSWCESRVEIQLVATNNTQNRNKRAIFAVNNHLQPEKTCPV